MDSITHIYFAHKLLVISGGNISASVCSLFPQIDREPAYFHRMFGHPFFNINTLAKIGFLVHKSKGDIEDSKKEKYVWNRFHNEYHRMKSFVDKFESETGITISKFNPDFLSVLLAYVSHTYQDIFNNPMQAFLPKSVYPSGKWELWSELDSINFRQVLYSPDNITAFREEFFSDPIWDTRIHVVPLIKAMIRRTAVSSVVQLPKTIEEEAFNSLSIETDGVETDFDVAEEFFIEHEILLSKLIRKYSKSPNFTIHFDYIPTSS